MLTCMGSEAETSHSHSAVRLIYLSKSSTEMFFIWVYNTRSDYHLMRSICVHTGASKLSDF